MRGQGSPKWKDVCRMFEDKRARRALGDEVIDCVNTSALFTMDEPAVEAALEQYSGREGPRNAETLPPFPFPRMAIMGPRGALIVADPIKDLETGDLEFTSYRVRPGAELVKARTMMSGAGPVSHEVICAMLVEGGKFITPSYEPPAVDRALSRRAEDALSAAVRDGDEEKIAEFRRLLSEAKSAEKDQHQADVGLCDARMRQRELSARTSLSELVIGFACIAWINRPGAFVVRRGGEPRRKPKRGRIARESERPRYIVLEKDQIAARYRAAQAELGRRSPMPHLRRGHWRRVDGGRKVSWVRASHVGGKCVEWREGDVSYRVV